MRRRPSLAAGSAAIGLAAAMVALAFGAVLARPAAAAPQDLERHLQTARELRKANQPRAAIVELEAAYADSLQHRILLEMGVVHRKLALSEGRRDDAQRAVEELTGYLIGERAAQGGAPRDEATVLRQIKELRQRFRIPASTTDVGVGASAEAAPEPAAEPPAAEPSAAEPSAAEPSASASSTSPPASPLPPLAVGAPLTGTRPAREPPRAQRRLRALGLAGIGVSVALLGGAVAANVAWQNQVVHWNTGCSLDAQGHPGGSFGDNCPGAYDAIQLSRNLAIAGYATGGALAVGSLVLLLVSSRTRSDPRTAGLSCAPGAGLLAGCSVRFW